MKKAIVWFIAGCIAATSFSAYAEEVVESMIGKVVQGTLKVSTKDKKFTDAIIVDNVAYAPLRETYENAGYIVKYDGDNGVVTLEKRLVVNVEATKASINSIKKTIDSNIKGIQSGRETLGKLKFSSSPDKIKEIELTEKSIAESERVVERFTAEKAKLEQLLIDYDAQQTELTQ